MRNVGLAVAQTELVAFLDDDDWWADEKLDRQITAFADSSTVLVAANAHVISDGQVTRTYHDRIPHRIDLAALMRTNWVITSSVVARTKALRAVHGFPMTADLRACDDYVGWLKLAAVGNVVVFDEPLLFYSEVVSESVSGENKATGAQSRTLALRDFHASATALGLRLSRTDRRLLRSFSAQDR
jgi:glycosyltransferase involved in cell wall biosynthesis